jgi:FkbM family methyltransferase
MKAYTILGYSGGQEHGWNPILNCYSSLRRFEPEALIILVNNFNDTIHRSLESDKNLRYFKNETNFWELGAIQTAFWENPDVNMFFIIQDGITFTNKPVDFEDDIMFWENEFRNAAPDLDTIKLWCESYFPYLTHKYNLPSNRICHGLMCCLTRKTLQTLMDIGLKDIRVKNKAEACASECILGFLLREVNPSIRFYNEAGACPNLGYKNDPSKYEFMTKRALGRVTGVGNSRYMDSPSFIGKVNTNVHPSIPFQFHAEGVSYSSLLDALSKVPSSKYHSIFMNYYIANRPALLELTEKRYWDFQFEGNPLNINSHIKSIQHDLYILKEWGYYFHAESKDVKYDTSFLCDWAYHYRDNIYIKYNDIPLIFYKPDTYSEEIQIRSSINEIIIRNDYTLHLFKNKQQKIFVDIGANHGVATIVLAKQNPESVVYTYEPDARCFEYIKENIRLNNLTNVFPFHMAVTKNGIREIELFQSPLHSGGNTTSSSKQQQVNYYQKDISSCFVKATSLESIISENNIQEIELLKIDCEGAEYEILPNSLPLRNGFIKNIVGEFHEFPFLNIELNETNNPIRLKSYLSQYIEGLILIH